MDEQKFAKVCREYVKILDSQNDQKPFGWSQNDHTREHNRYMALLDEARVALTVRL